MDLKLKELLIKAWKDGNRNFKADKGSIDYDADLEIFLEEIDSELLPMSGGKPSETGSNCNIQRVSGMLPDCKHENIESSDGCDECLDCGARNF